MSGPNQWNKLPLHIRKVRTLYSSTEDSYFQTAPTSTSEDSIKGRAMAKILTLTTVILTRSNVNVNQHVKYLGQMSFSSKVIDWIHAQEHTNTEPYKQTALLAPPKMFSEKVNQATSDAENTIKMLPMSLYL